MDNFLFTGLGFCPGRYITTNDQIKKSLEQGYLDGFNKARVESGESYRQYRESGGTFSPFAFMAEHKMGFRNRAHVVPYPPVKPAYKRADTSLDLAIKATDEAIQDAGLSPDDIDMWMVSTATAHEMAPGLAATLKCYFVPYDNQTPTHSLTSACVGFNINLELAIQRMKSKPDIKHILIVHTEVMSELLCNETDFVPVTSFGDSAAAIVLSRTEGNTPEGVQQIRNHEDLRMIDFLGANKSGDLYMDPRIVKSRAVPNMVSVINDISSKENKHVAEYDYFIPHQTGHAIVKNVAALAGVPDDICYQDVQLTYGNLSGASVPAGFYELKKAKKLRPGMHMLTAVAGLGGEYGGFSYIVPKKPEFTSNGSHLKGKTVFITGATGDLAGKTIQNLIKQQARLILHCRNTEKANQLKERYKDHSDSISFVTADLSIPEEVESLARRLSDELSSLDYFIHNAASTGSLSRASEVSKEEMKTTEHVNHRSARILIEALSDKIRETVLFVGSVAEDALYSGSSAYVSSKRALHAWAVELAKRFYRENKRVVYYMPGIIDTGMAAKLNEAQISASMLAIRQKELIPPEAIADRIVKSLYLPKVHGVEARYEGALMVRRDAYMKEDLS
ncbi:MAG TPA: SDR family NAD(P)-dependent oxidoreductase [Bacteroidales bacterium]|nr:SDR family NAD(P)-dependent oxidoreductase [Bacteroidales bacterium]